MSIKTVLKYYLLLTSIYLILDGIVHVLGIKLTGIITWPEPALIYSKFITNLYGGFVILAGLFGIETARNLSKYRNFLLIGAVWSLIYAAFLVYSSITIDFVELFTLTPSIYFWIPFYNFYIITEAGLMVILAMLIFFFSREKS